MKKIKKKKEGEIEKQNKIINIINKKIKRIETEFDRLKT